MPLIPINYDNGSIYKNVCNDILITDCYVGSTTNIVKRRQKHKYNSSYTYGKKYHVYQFIREHGGWNNWSLILIENYPCNNKLELEKRERYYIEELKATLNKYIPTRTDKEYYEDHKAKYKKYYEDHKEKYKKYYEDHKEKYKKYYEERKKKE